MQQLKNACKLPVAVSGALMPDAHVGYGLPIGGVLATQNAVIPVRGRRRHRVPHEDDRAGSAARLRSTDEQSRLTQRARARDALRRRRHVPIAAPARRHGRGLERHAPSPSKLKDRAWAQLGTSGSGNHFVEFGELTVDDGAVGLRAGTYLALLSHSGSRGTGAQVAAALQPAGARAPSGAAEGAVASGVARSVDRGGPGILGGDGADGPICGGESRADSRAHRASARRRGAARHREPSQLRLARASSAARRIGGARSSSTARARRRPAPACSASSPARWARRATSSAAKASPRR